MAGIHWVICGGESGPHARPMHPAWARSLRDQCAAANVPFFFKQWGEWLPVEQAPFLKDPLPITMLRKGHKFADESISIRIGKKLAGDLLDGTSHHHFPNS
jgi:hypothetical protein